MGMPAATNIVSDDAGDGDNQFGSGSGAGAKPGPMMGATTMPRWDFWNKRQPADEPLPPSPPPTEPARTASYGSPPPIRTRTPPVLSPERRDRRVADLRRRRAGLLFDIEQAERARAPDNPWQEQIQLLRESIATIATDRARLDAAGPEPTWTVPTLRLTELSVSIDDPVEVAFTLDRQVFRYVEATDWDNRGGMVVRGDLRLVSGDPSLVARDLRTISTPPSWEPILASALMTFALDIRDTALDGGKLPIVLTLRDIIHEDNDVGGWSNIHGTNNVRVQRAFARQEFRAEENRLAAELAREDDQRRTLVDRLPIARKRLATLRDELVALGVDPDRP